LTAFVLDASVAVKWVIPPANETLSAEALRLLERYVTGEIDFVVPDIFWAEIGDVLWKGARQQRWPRNLADGAVSALKDRNFLTISTQVLLPAALKIALLYDRSVYDAMYVATAIQFKIDMITADECLANALAASLPVKWLGAFVT
jgi:predicted nucleic acid-binding protein